jgi:hypothetical protein
MTLIDEMVQRPSVYVAKHAGIIEEENSYYSGTSRSKDDSKEGGESSEGDRDNHIELASFCE